jgi:hypothetical protein
MARNFILEWKLADEDRWVPFEDDSYMDAGVKRLVAEYIEDVDYLELEEIHLLYKNRPKDTIQYRIVKKD